MQIPYLSFKKMHDAVKPQIISAFENFYDSHWYVAGPLVKQFEKEFAEYTGVQNAIGVSNGLDALFLALKSLGIGKGDEVIIPSNTYIATALAVSYVGATPVLVEPKINTYNIDPENIIKAITKNTKAIIPVHLYGQTCEMLSIMQIASENKLHVIEDNAQAHGATFQNNKTGSFGIINATSFYPGKNLGALGEAGCITTNNPELATIVSSLRNYGSTEKYYNELMGHNMRMDEFQAAVLSIKLGYLNVWTIERQKLAAQYQNTLEGINEIILPQVEKDATHVYHIYAIRTKQRNALQQYLNEKGISTMIHYPVPIHLQKAYAHLNFKPGDFPIAEEIANTTLSLPCWPGLNEDQIKFIAEHISGFFAKHARKKL